VGQAGRRGRRPRLRRGRAAVPLPAAAQARRLPRDGDDGAGAAEQLGRLSALVLDDDTTRGQYLDRTDQPRRGFTPGQLARRGAFVQFRVELVGYRGTAIPLERELVNARTGDELGQLRAVTITPHSERVESPWHDWVPLRPGKGSDVLVVKLLDERGVRALDCLQSPPFGGLAGSVPGKRLGLCAGTARR
jgi:hypothetical protein